jgi:hypothetical protein
MVRKRSRDPQISDRTFMRYVVDRKISVDRLTENFRNRRLQETKKDSPGHCIPGSM